VCYELCVTIGAVRIVKPEENFQIKYKDEEIREVPLQDPVRIMLGDALIFK